MTTPAVRRPNPRKSLGQHFLINGRVLSRIVSAAEITSQDLVLEIGPGTGALTRRLVGHGCQVVAIELDHQLAVALPYRLGNPPNLTVIEGDARKTDLSTLVAPGNDYKVVGNLPYYAANPIVRRFLETAHQPRLMVVTVQEEVARSMSAMPGKMGMLSVAVQFYARPKLVCTVPSRAFNPPPKVSSAVIRLDIRPKPEVKVTEPGPFFGLVKAGFSSPRKQLRNSLAHGLGASSAVVGRLLASLDLDATRRPATLSLEEWALINDAWEQLEKVENPSIC